MKPVDQRGDSDCFRACVASILEYDLEDVPLWEDHPDWFVDVVRWGRIRGFRVTTIARQNLPEDLHVIAGGDSPRGPWGHAVVWLGGPDGRIVHDPHPSRAGLVGEPEDFVIFQPKRYDPPEEC